MKKSARQKEEPFLTIEAKINHLQDDIWGQEICISIPESKGERKMGFVSEPTYEKYTILSLRFVEEGEAKKVIGCYSFEIGKYYPQIVLYHVNRFQTIINTLPKNRCIPYVRDFGIEYKFSSRVELYITTELECEDHYREVAYWVVDRFITMFTFD